MLSMYVVDENLGGDNQFYCLMNNHTVVKQNMEIIQ